MTDPRDIVARFLDAFATGDRDAAEALIGADFTFTSPRDNALDRAAWFSTCWGHHDRIAGFDILLMAVEGQRVCVMYEAVASDGGRFRNTEIFTVAAGQVQAVEVFFGWSLPHPAPGGGSLPG